MLHSEKELIVATTQSQLQTLIYDAVASATQKFFPQQNPITNTIDLIPRKEVMKQLNVSESTLIRWNKLGLLPAYEIGAKIFYKHSDIHNSLKSIHNSSE